MLQLRIVCRNHAVACSAQILGGNQSEAAKGPEVSNSLLFPPSANGLGGILDCSKMVPRNRICKGASLTIRSIPNSLSTGLRPRVASEALKADVRDLEVDVRKFLQAAGKRSFQEAKAAAGEKQMMDDVSPDESVGARDRPEPARSDYRGAAFYV